MFSIELLSVVVFVDGGLVAVFSELTGTMIGGRSMERKFSEDQVTDTMQTRTERILERNRKEQNTKREAAL